MRLQRGSCERAEVYRAELQAEKKNLKVAFVFFFVHYIECLRKSVKNVLRSQKNEG